MRPSHASKVVDGPTVWHHVRIFEGILMGNGPINTHRSDPLPLIGSTHVVQPALRRSILIGRLVGKVTKHANDMICCVRSRVQFHIVNHEALPTVCGRSTAVIDNGIGPDVEF